MGNSTFIFLCKIVLGGSGFLTVFPIQKYFSTKDISFSQVSLPKVSQQEDCFPKGFFFMSNMVKNL